MPGDEAEDPDDEAEVSTARDRLWAEFDAALRAVSEQAREAGLHELSEGELTDAVEQEEQTVRREKRERREQ